jgi:hypothetical protein
MAKIYPPESWCCWSGRAWGSGNASRAKGWGWSVGVDCHFGFAHRHPILGGFGKVDDFFECWGNNVWSLLNALLLSAVATSLASSSSSALPSPATTFSLSTTSLMAQTCGVEWRGKIRFFENNTRMLGT